MDLKRDSNQIAEIIKNFEEIYQRYKSALYSKIPIVYTGPDLRTIAECSKGAELYFGIDRDSLIGMDATKLYENESIRNEIVKELDKKDVIVKGISFTGNRYAEVTITKRRDENNNVIGTLGIAIDKTYEREWKQKASNHLLNILQTLYNTIELKTKWIKGHSDGVAKYSVVLAKEFGYDLYKIYRYARLHDIGKLKIAEKLLDSPKKFKEKNPIAIHAREGDLILELHLTTLGYPYDTLLKNIVRHHHEYFNGKGYPDRKKGEEIPLEARIVGIADAYEAMIAGRPYRKKRSKEEAIKELKRCAGTQFDPKLTDKFIKYLKREEP